VWAVSRYVAEKDVAARYSLPCNFRTNELNPMAISAPRQPIKSVFITVDTACNVSMVKQVLLEFQTLLRAMSLHVPFRSQHHVKYIYLYYLRI
jgi:hypothetical protein